MNRYPLLYRTTFIFSKNWAIFLFTRGSSLLCIQLSLKPSGLKKFAKGRDHLRPSLGLPGSTLDKLNEQKTELYEKALVNSLTARLGKDPGKQLSILLKGYFRKSYLSWDVGLSLSCLALNNQKDFFMQFNSVKYSIRELIITFYIAN